MRRGGILLAPFGYIQEMADMSQHSAPELVRQASEQISTLVRDEIRLARAEMMAKGRHAAMGVGLFGGATLLTAYGVAALLVAAGFALALVMPGWAAALMVGGVLMVAAGVQALVGRRQLKESTPLTPERTMESVREDVRTLSTAVEERNR